MTDQEPNEKRSINPSKDPSKNFFRMQRFNVHPERIVRHLEALYNQSRHYTSERPQIARYALVILSISIITLAHFNLNQIANLENPFLLFFASIMLSAWYGGLVPGMLATICSAVVIDYFFITPQNNFHIATTQDQSTLALFIIEGFLISLLSEYHLGAEKIIKHQALHDPLTKVPNRILFEDRAESLIKRAHRNNEHFAILFLDLDGFKAINDRLGHRAGDDILKQVATRLIGSTREEDTVARIGGDEFVILLNEIESRDDAKFVTQKILTDMSRPYNYKNSSFNVSTSIGISIFPQDGEEVLILMQHADTALYQVKESGRNNFRFYSQQ